jgi:dephospho-CoA kinase
MVRVWRSTLACVPASDLSVVGGSTAGTRPWALALTGGVASGKSEVARRFIARGVTVYDADVVARDLVAPGSEALNAIVATFGPSVLNADGSLDRRAMRDRVFADAGARLRLESILHPRVRAELARLASIPKEPYVILVIPLFVETGAYGWVDRVLVVDAMREGQLARLTSRDGIAPALAESMLASQASRAARLAVADDVIDNAGSLVELDATVDRLHRQYLALAARRERADWGSE